VGRGEHSGGTGSEAWGGERVERRASTPCGCAAAAAASRRWPSAAAGIAAPPNDGGSSRERGMRSGRHSCHHTPREASGAARSSRLPLHTDNNP
jgi:hypothetical protein